MRRRLFTLLSALSLVLFVAESVACYTAMLWRAIHFQWSYHGHRFALELVGEWWELQRFAPPPSHLFDQLFRAPHFLVLPALGALPIAFMVGRLGERIRSRRIGFCPACGYDLRATPDRCPECGAVPARTGSSA